MSVILTLEEAQIKEVEILEEEVNQLERTAKRVLHPEEHDFLEKNYNAESYAAKAVDSKNQILCTVDRVREFTENRQFYQLREAIDDALNQIRLHQENFPGETLGDAVFNRIRNGTNTQIKSLRTIVRSAGKIKDIDKLDENSSTDQLKIWAKSLEILGEEIEANIFFLTIESFKELESIAETVVLKCRCKKWGDNKDLWRRRLRYAAGFLIRLIESAEDDAIAEEQEIIRGFQMLSQPVLQEVWEDDKD